MILVLIALVCILLCKVEGYQIELNSKKFPNADSDECDTSTTDCVSCLNNQNRCVWCISESKCKNRDGLLHGTCSSSSTSSVYYPDTCPIAWPTEEPEFLPNWMEKMMPAIGYLTLLDLALPGTHDSLTYNLSLTTSNAGIDDYLLLAEIMHNYTKLIPDGVEDFIRQQAQTQAMSIIQQLNSGVRFIDFRIMFEYSDPLGKWYSLHFLQTLQTANIYFKEIRSWLDSHPEEVIVLWLSKHGSQCATGEDQYPNTPIAEKQAYWQEITNIFDGLLVDFDKTKINETSISGMVKSHSRVVIYATDYVEMTNSSSLALDGCLVDNYLGPGVSNEPEALAWERGVFQTAEETKATDKAQSKFFLMSMATGVPAEQVIYAAKIKWLNYDEADVMKCAEAFGIPGLDWCPETLLDIANLENYYKQISLEEALWTPGWGFPNAIYLNALDWDGTIRTGNQNLWGAHRGNSTQQNTSYAYADTLLLYNLKQVCDVSSHLYNVNAENCVELRELLDERRAMHPKQLWMDAKYGRLVNWP